MSMKKLILAGSLLVAGAAFAQDEPAAGQPGATTVRIQGQAQAVGGNDGRLRIVRAGVAGQPARLEKATWLGIACAPLPPDVRQKLDLARGMGLRIMQVEPNSPAQRAGVTTGDVLLRINEQQLFNEAQLRALIRTFKVDDEITLNIVRGDKPMSITTKLAEREMPALDDMPVFVGAGMLDWPLPNVAGTIAISGAATNTQNMTRIDSDGVQIQVTDDGKVRSLKAIGADGKVLFDGPINTEEQRKTVPADLLKRVGDVHVDVNVAPAPGMPPMPGNQMVLLNRMGEQKIDWSDGDVDLTLTIQRKGKNVTTHLLVKDDTGKQLFDGPVDTREQRGDVPTNLQDKLIQALLKNFQEAGGPFNPIRIQLEGR